MLSAVLFPSWGTCWSVKFVKLRWIAILYHDINCIEIILQLALFWAILESEPQSCQHCILGKLVRPRGIPRKHRKKCEKLHFSTRYGTHDLDSRFGTSPYFKGQLASGLVTITQQNHIMYRSNIIDILREHYQRGVEEHIIEYLSKF